MACCPNLMNEIMVPTGGQLAASPGGPTRLGNSPQDINAGCPCQIIAYGEMDACGHLG